MQSNACGARYDGYFDCDMATGPGRMIIVGKLNNYLGKWLIS